MSAIIGGQISKRNNALLTDGGDGSCSTQPRC